MVLHGSVAEHGWCSDPPADEAEGVSGVFDVAEDASRVVCSPESARGAFAFAERKRDAVSLTVDWLAQIPIYFRVDRQGIRWADSPSALRSGDAVDEQQVALHLVERQDEAQGHLFAGIKAVAPGSTVRWRRGEGDVTTERWWHPPSSTDAPAEPASSLRERMAETLSDWRAGAGCAVLASGGLDAPTVAALCSPPPLLLALSFPGLECDERALVELLARHLAAPLIVSDATLQESLTRPGLDRVPTPMVDFFDPLLAAARAAGRSLVLTGLGADHFMSRERFYDLRQAVARRSPQEAWAALTPFTFQSLKLAAAALAWQLSPGHALRARRRAPHRAWLRRRVGEIEAGVIAGGGREPDPRQLVHFRTWDLVTGPNMAFALAQAHFAGQAVGVRIRHPFFAPRVADWLGSLPRPTRLGNRITGSKPLLRGPGSPLPRALRHRTSKSSFRPYLEWLVRRRHRTEIESWRRDSRLGDLGLIEPAGLIYALDSQPAEDLISTIGMECWLRKVSSNHVG